MSKTVSTAAGIPGLSRRAFVAGGVALAGLGAALALPGLARADEAEGDAKADAADAEAETGAEDADAAVAFDPNDPATVYVPASWVKSVIDGNEDASDDYVVLEVAWGEEADDPNYGAGHIPGAVHMNTDLVEEDQYWNIRSAEEIEALCGAYGITKDTVVICYGTAGTDSADDRVALALLWAGVENVKCLDGGYEKWVEAGYEEETDSNAPAATDEAFGVEVPAHPEYILSIDEVKEKLADDPDFKLVSIRSYAEFCGETSGYSYIDRAGEPEGAIWGRDTDDGSYCNEDGTTVGVDAVEEYLAESGAELDEDTAWYCGTGWRAAIPFLICLQAGVVTSVYDGGWFVWQMDPENDVQLGDPQAGEVEYVKVADLPTDKAKF